MQKAFSFSFSPLSFLKNASGLGVGWDGGEVRTIKDSSETDIYFGKSIGIEMIRHVC